jgi:hypothetical protein
LDLNGIDLPLNMRLWHTNGLHAILSDPETVTAAMKSSATTDLATCSRTSAPKATKPAKPDSQPSRSAATRPTAAPKPTHEPTQEASSRQQKSRAKNRSAGKMPKLPPSLQTYFSRLTVPAFSLWTYWDLPVDLGETPNTARQNLVKRMRMALAWPSGSSVFWPISRLEQGEIVADLDLFTFGVRTITPVYIFCFGEQGCSLLAPDKNPKSLQRAASPHTSSMIQFLPSLNAMLPDNRDLKNIAWKILKGYSPMPM